MLEPEVPTLPESQIVYCADICYSHGLTRNTPIGVEPDEGLIMEVADRKT